jgi:hypothetical protein
MDEFDRQFLKDVAIAVAVLSVLCAGWLAAGTVVYDWVW